MKKLLLHILLFVVIVAPMMAAEPDSVLTEHLTIWNGLSSEAWKNPALHGKAYLTNYSQLTLEGDYQHQTDAFVLQKGTGHMLYQVEADTYLRLSDRTAVWGKASYIESEHQMELCIGLRDYGALYTGRYAWW